MRKQIELKTKIFEVEELNIEVKVNWMRETITHPSQVEEGHGFHTITPTEVTNIVTGVFIIIGGKQTSLQDFLSHPQIKHIQSVISNM